MTRREKEREDFTDDYERILHASAGDARRKKGISPVKRRVATLSESVQRAESIVTPFVTDRS